MLGIFSWAHLSGEDDGRIGFRNSGLRPEVKKRVRSYLELIVISTVMIWTGLSLFFGAVHKRSANAHNLDLYVIDLDGGEVGTNITQMVMGTERSSTLPTWFVKKDMATFEDARAWVRNKGWGALVINAGTSDRLQKALTEGAEYDSSKALTVLESSGKQIVAEMLFVQTALSTAASQVCMQYAVHQVDAYQLQGSAEKQAQTNFGALVNPLSFTTVDVSPEGFVLAPVLMTFGFLSCLLCTVGILILWRMTTFAFFVKVRYRDLILMWYFLILCHSLIISLYLSFAILAFRGPNYNSVALPYTGATFFKIWFTSAAVVLALALWLFICFQFMTPHLLALPSICTIIPNTVSTIAPLELAPKFYRIMYAVPFFNGSKLVHHIISGGYPTLRQNIGVLAAEIAFMAICLGVAIWFRQVLVLRGISDPQGWYRGSLFFNSPISYYKSDPASTEKRNGDDIEQGSSSPTETQQTPHATRSHHNHVPSGSTLSANNYGGRDAASRRNRSKSIEISDENADGVSLKTGNLGG
ncbi:hypothetical protein IW140_005347 [Coemansia sp. RSA 1813]|nr:hypothetical protein EV178_005278 [Coemansia sp. RSA 1646]KAJ1765301.1 hypothetical protein LPJ74_006404 [Coemansia sp. RSA 1843]KAJ2086986.1 hypothetical protein IW138_005266 [Coemansia sp. RSA 986]KAJ2215595.1 hypothetical protein EV179_002005 [Coemansia sp. RSA 487]KAJ2565450.1 hypothetical protein IW140_005347 [Coemansia sp. RSA 1813]